MARNPNAIESEPCFCYSRQINEVQAICRRLFIMSPVNSCSDATQINSTFERWRHSVEPGVRQEHPIFFFVKDHKNPVPTSFWPVLEKMGAILVGIQRA